MIMELSIENARVIFEALKGDRSSLAEAIEFIIAATADNLNEAEGVVSATEFLFSLQEGVNHLVAAAEEKVVAEFKGRPEDLVNEIVNLKD
jgi:hypothetical protein